MSLKNVARLDLVELGRVLSTRPAGREAGRLVAEKLDASSGVLLNFNGVDVASPSFLDELVRGIRAQLSGGSSNPWLLVTGTNEDVTESMELILERHKLALGALEGGHLDLLGGSTQLRETLREAQEMGTFTAPQLAERLEIKLPALHQRLNQLLEGGAIERSADATARRGKRGLFNVPDDEALSCARDLPPSEQLKTVMTS